MNENKINIHEMEITSLKVTEKKSEDGYRLFQLNGKEFFWDGITIWKDGERVCSIDILDNGELKIYNKDKGVSVRTL